MIPYIAVALLDAMRNSDTAEILHYVFCVIDPPYLVFGGIYYIDRVGSSVNCLLLKSKHFSACKLLIHLCERMLW